MGGFLLKLLGGGIIGQITDPLLKAYERKVNAENDEARLAAEREIAALEAARDIAVEESRYAFSATRIGRLLIVVPFGIWWAALWLIQIVNPWIMQPFFGVTLVVVELPPEVYNMAMVLVPAIVIGDAGALMAGRFLKR